MQENIQNAVHAPRILECAPNESKLHYVNTYKLSQGGSDADFVVCGPSSNPGWGYPPPNPTQCNIQIQVTPLNWGLS